MKKNRSALTMIGVVAILVTLVVVPVVSAAVGVDSSELREAVELENIIEHLEDLEAIGPRPAGDSGSGYDAAAAYVGDLLEYAGYDVTYQDFMYDLWEELSDPMLEQVSPNPTVYVEDTHFATMDYSGSGDVTALVQPTMDIMIPPGAAPNTSTSGCEAADFADFTPGNIALIQRGYCYYFDKAWNAQNAGAAGVIIFNEGQPGRDVLMYGTLGGPGLNIPVVSTSFFVGEELYDLTLLDDVEMHMVVESVMHEDVPTTNVIAETPSGRDDRVVVVGAHLDTEAVGPGTNDNGSGVATILEIAEQMAELGIEPRNKVVFAFWSAEEEGLLGAEYYVNSLTKRERKNIALNLNFDMLASNNYALFVYDGDGSDTPETGPGPNGSGNIEDVFLDYFAEQGLVTWATAFDGRSDYGPFIEVGIPAGGLFSGGDGTKTEEQAAIYGGTAGEFYDPYYHTAGDTLANINETSLDHMSDAVAHAVLAFAMTTSSVNGTGKASDRAVENMSMEFRGPRTQQ
jgi:Zn-dependent M28 family amino/carboxypeptidase